MDQEHKRETLINEARGLIMELTDQEREEILRPYRGKYETTQYFLSRDRICANIG